MSPKVSQSPQVPTTRAPSQTTPTNESTSLTSNVQAPEAPESQEGEVASNLYLNNGSPAAPNDVHTDAHFATAQGRGASGTSVLGLQLAEGTQSLEMAPVQDAPQVEGAQSVAAVQRARAAEELRQIPTVADLESLKSGDLQPADVASRLKKGLLSSNPQAVKKAAKTLQIAESYARKAAQDRENYKGTGFQPYPFPKLEVNLNADETVALMKRITQVGDGATADIALLATKEGLLQTTPPGIFHSHRGVMGLHTGASGQLTGSNGQEAPRGASTFREEWKTQVEPGMRNISEAIAETAKAKGPGCPYAQGNHAKGVAFDNAKMTLDPQAPAWAHDLLGSSIEGGMIRVSGSQTDPDQPDQESHMPGIRIAFPVKGALDGSATQLIDITANTGSTTHAKTAAEHTQFTKDISVPKKGIAGWRPVRAARHALGALLGPGKVLDRVRAMRNAVQVTDMAMGQRFHEHEFFGRHAFFVGGRYVQVRFAVVEPKNFPDPNQSNDPNARLNAVTDTVAQGGLKLAMYMTELPEGRPEMVEQEGWEGLPEVRLATIDVPPQTHDNHSPPSQWFEDVPHVPGGQDKVFHAVGLGRHRVPIYMQSGKVRNTHNRQLNP